jgi:hypothetical protein
MFQSDGVPIDVTQLGKAIDYSSEVWLLFFGTARVPQIAHYRTMISSRSLS